MMQLSIEIAQAGDIPALQEVAEASWRATYAHIFAPEFIDRYLANAYDAESLRQAMARADSHFLVARLDSYLVGYAQAGIGRAGPGSFELYRLYVAPAHWRQGIGAGLIAGIEAWLKRQGATRYSCYVHSQNDVGKAFYQKAGFIHHRADDHDGEWCMVKEIFA
jgi:GNAT superfamily N-acetyltransferase